VAKTEFIITLRVTVDADEGYGYKHPVLWRWFRMVSRSVSSVTEVDILNCSPLRTEEEDLTAAGWSPNAEQMYREWAEERDG